MNTYNFKYMMIDFVKRIKPFYEKELGHKLEEYMFWVMMGNFSPHFEMSPWEWYEQAKNKDDAINDIEGVLLRMYK